MKGPLTPFLAMLLLLVSTGAFGHTIITRTADGEKVALSRMASAAALTDVILVGESHDTPAHHELQLNLLRVLHEQGLPVSLGVEMVQSDYQQQLDAWVAGELSEARMQQVFELNWSDWPMYRDIFLFARQQRIPMVALNVPRALIRKISESGFDALTAEEKRGLPATGCDLANPQVRFLRKIFATVAHHAQNGRKFEHFCEAQAARNGGMAAHIGGYLAKEPPRKMVVLTGVWHAVKYAIPDQLQRQGSSLSCTVIIPESPYLNGANAGSADTDYLVEL